MSQLNSHHLPDQDTIVAQATAPGRGSVGIVRISGPRAQFYWYNVIKNASDTKICTSFAFL